VLKQGPTAVMMIMIMIMMIMMMMMVVILMMWRAWCSPPFLSSAKIILKDNHNADIPEDKVRHLTQG
jgi:hypothetical protein